MIAPVIELPITRLEGIDAMLFGFEACRWAPEYRCGFCFVPYAAGTTERANFLVGAAVAVFGAAH